MVFKNKRETETVAPVMILLLHQSDILGTDMKFGQDTPFKDS